jgi:hypothetical protein
MELRARVPCRWVIAMMLPLLCVKPPRVSASRKIVTRDGKVCTAELGRPCQGTGSAWTDRKLPRAEPP